MYISKLTVADLLDDKNLLWTVLTHEHGVNMNEVSRTATELLAKYLFNH